MRKIALLLVLLILFVSMVSCRANDEPDVTDSYDTSSVASESESETESSAVTDDTPGDGEESDADTKENWSHRY